MIRTKKVEVPDDEYRHKEKPLKLEIYREQHPIDPRGHGNNGIMACSHGRYDLGEEDLDTDRFSSWQEIETHIRESNNVIALLPLYLYDHSGLSMSTSPFRSRWDSGKVGFIYATEESMRAMGHDDPESLDREKVLDWLRGEVEMYDQYLRGEVYRYVLVDDGEQIDSCGGFYGRDTDSMWDYVGHGGRESFEQQG